MAAMVLSRHFNETLKPSEPVTGRPVFDLAHPWTVQTIARRIMAGVSMLRNLQRHQDDPVFLSILVVCPEWIRDAVDLAVLQLLPLGARITCKNAIEGYLILYPQPFREGVTLGVAYPTTWKEFVVADQEQEEECALKSTSS